MNCTVTELEKIPVVDFSQWSHKILLDKASPPGLSVEGFFSATEVGDDRMVGRQYTKFVRR